MKRFNEKERKLVGYFACGFCNNNQNLSDKREQFEINEESYSRYHYRLICWYCISCWKLNITKIERLYSLREGLTIKENKLNFINGLYKFEAKKQIFRINGWDENMIKDFNIIIDELNWDNFKINATTYNSKLLEKFKNFFQKSIDFKLSNYYNLPSCLFETTLNHIKNNKPGQILKNHLKEYSDNYYLNNKYSMAMLARKILLCILDFELKDSEKQNLENWKFVEICDYLKQSNLLGKKQNKDFEIIRQIGNQANHKTSEITDKIIISLNRIFINLINACYNY